MAKRTLKESTRPDRRRLLLAAVVGGAVLALGIWAGAKLGNWLPLNRMKAHGLFEQVNVELLREVLLPYTGDGLVGMDVDAAVAALESLPWVRRAEVRRLWPDLVEVRFYEQNAFARWGDSALVNEAGELFVPLKESWPEDLPELAGPPGAAAMIAYRYREMQLALDPLGLHITAVTVDARRAWRLRLDNGIDLMLGREHHLERLARFVDTYGSALADRAGKIERIDLRYTNGFAVRWTDAGAAVGAG